MSPRWGFLLFSSVEEWNDDVKK